MKHGSPRPILRFVAMVVLGGGLSFVAASPAWGAGDGYGPAPAPTPTPAPVVTCPTGPVITSTTLTGGAGGTLSGTAGAAGVTVTVPAGAFPSGVQVAIINTASIAVAPTGDSIVLAFGVNFCANGTKVTGSFAEPVTVTVTDPAIQPGQTLYLQTATGLVPVAATISNGSLTLTVDNDPNFVLVTAPSTSAAVIPGATSVVTGKPFLPEGIVAGVLVLSGALLLVARLRLRHR